MSNTIDNRQELFNYLSDELNAIALQSNLADIEQIVIKSEAVQIAKLEAIQKYLLEHGSNDETINEEILILKGLKQRKS